MNQTELKEHKKYVKKSIELFKNERLLRVVTRQNRNIDGHFLELDWKNNILLVKRSQPNFKNADSTEEAIKPERSWIDATLKVSDVSYICLRDPKDSESYVKNKILKSPDSLF